MPIAIERNPMPVDPWTGIKDILHELQPWATVAGAAIAAFAASQAMKGKEYGKKAALFGEQAVKKADVAAVKAEEAATLAAEAKAKIDEVHTAVNGRVEQLVTASTEVARREGYDQGAADNQSVQQEASR